MGDSAARIDLRPCKSARQCAVHNKSDAAAGQQQRLQHSPCCFQQVVSVSQSPGTCFLPSGNNHPCCQPPERCFSIVCYSHRRSTAPCARAWAGPAPLLAAAQQTPSVNASHLTGLASGLAWAHCEPTFEQWRSARQQPLTLQGWDPALLAPDLESFGVLELSR
jgi:hypothetical protein